IVVVGGSCSQGLQSHCGRIKRSRNLVVGEWSPLERCGVRGLRVVDDNGCESERATGTDRARNTRVNGVAKVALPHGRRGNKWEDRVRTLVVAKALVVKKPERLVTLDGAAHVSAELILDDLGYLNVQGIGA